MEGRDRSNGTEVIRFKRDRTTRKCVVDELDGLRAGKLSESTQSGAVKPNQFHTSRI